MRLAPLLFALILPMALPSQAQTRFLNLNSLRDRARPLLIFAPRSDDRQLLEQLRSLQEVPEAIHALADRQVILVAIPADASSIRTARLSTADEEAARRRFHIAPTDFMVILLGKDGGEKLRSSKPLSLETICGTIDAMPMRQEEMRLHPRR